MDYESFKKTIEEAESIIILSHVNPDGDTLGTMCALFDILKNSFNKNSDMFASGKIPDIYKFLPESENIKFINDIEPDKVYDLAIAVDVAAKDRLRDGAAIFDRAIKTINIDHHKTNNNYGNLNFVNGSAACAGEVLLEITEKLGLNLTEKAATALYTSFMTDTGGFRYENTKAETLEKAARLINYGANPSRIAGYCYDSKPKSMVLLHANSIINAKFSDNNKIAYVIITNKDMERFNAENDHTEGIVESLRQINTTEVSFVLKEVDENTTKVSLRSKTIDVSEIAEIFNGGGHTFAAGCTIKKPVKIACDKLTEEIRKRL